MWIVMRSIYLEATLSAERATIISVALFEIHYFLLCQLNLQQKNWLELNLNSITIKCYRLMRRYLSLETIKNFVKNLMSRFQQKEILMFLNICRFFGGRLAIAIRSGQAVLIVDFETRAPSKFKIKRIVTCRSIISSLGIFTTFVVFLNSAYLNMPLIDFWTIFKRIEIEINLFTVRQKLFSALILSCKFTQLLFYCPWCFHHWK